MRARWIVCGVVLLGSLLVAETIWGPVVLSEPDTVLPKAWPAVNANSEGEYALVWHDCRDGGWPGQGIFDNPWFRRYLGRVNRAGSALAPNLALDPPGWVVEETERDMDVLLFDDGGYWILFRQDAGRHTVYFWNAEDELEDSLKFVGMAQDYRWAKTIDGKAVIVYFIQSGENKGLHLRFLSKDGADTVTHSGLEGYSPKVAVNFSGEIAVAYEKHPEEFKGEVYWLCCDQSGELITDPIFVDSGFVGDVAWGPQDRVMVTWLYSVMGEVYPYARLYDNAGSPVGASQKMDSESCKWFGPVSAASSQGYLTVWSVDDPEVLRGSILNINGDVLVSSFEVGTHYGNLDGWCWADGDADGYTAMWLQDNHVYGRRFTLTGSPAAEPYTVDDDSLGSLAGWSEAVLAPDGSGFVIWAPYDMAEFNSGVRLRRFSENGVAGETWFRDDVCAGPSIAITPDGGAWLSYIRAEAATDTEYVSLQRFDNQGKPSGDEITFVSGDWGSRSSNTAVAVKADGDGVLAWTDENDDGVWFQFVQHDGSLKGEPIHAIEGFDVRFYLDVCYFDDGGFLVTVGSATAAKARLFNPDGTPRGEAFFLVNAADGDRPNDGLSVASNGKDRFVATWVKFAIDGYGARLFDRQGNRVDTAIAEEHPMSDPLWFRNPFHFAPAVAMDTSGRWVVAWTEEDEAKHLVVKGQMYDRDGAKLGGRFAIPSAFPGYERFQGTTSLASAGGKLLYTFYGSARHRGVEVYGMLTDWEIPPGVSEEPPVTHSNWEITQSVGRDIMLRYADSPQGFRADIFDVTGRKVDEITSAALSGTITWGDEVLPGVYFIRAESKGRPVVQKVVLIR